MRRLIHFIERFSLEKHFYTRTVSSDGETQWEIYWNTKHHSDGLWGIKPLKGDEWKFYDAEQLCNAIRFLKLDTDIIELEMVTYIKSMITHAKLMEKEAKNLLGPNIINIAMDEFSEFTDALTNMISHFMTEVKEKKENDESKRPKLSIVKQET